MGKVVLGAELIEHRVYAQLSHRPSDERKVPYGTGFNGNLIGHPV